MIKAVPSMPSPHPVLSSLRQATAQRHQAIDRLLRIDAYLDRDRYIRILAAFDGFFAVWEPRIQAVLPEHLARWFLARSRRPFLEQDMRVLGARSLELASPGAPAWKLTSGCASRLHWDDRSAAFGSMYVLEGSALGGLVIAKRVAQALGIDPRNGGAFFAGWGRDTGRHWREFRQVLEFEVGGAPDSLERARHAAVDTFDVLTETFSRVLDVDLA